MHMVEHLLVGDIAALLIVLGLTGPLIAPILRIKLFDRLRVLSHPAIAFPLWAIDLYVWHIPALYQAALRHTGVHALEHAMFLGFGVNMWMCLFGPLPTPALVRQPRAARSTSSPCASPAPCSATSSSGRGPSSTPSTATATPSHHISPLADQNIAGAIMMVEESFLTLGLFCWLFLRAAREGEERQNLLDYAQLAGPRAERGARRARRRRRARAPSCAGAWRARRAQKPPSRPDRTTPLHARGTDAR